MVSRCANPGCGARFHYLSQGRLFHFEVAAKSPDRTSSAGPRLVGQRKKVEHFWLCSKCASSMTLKFDNDGVAVVPFERRHAAAS